MVDRPLLGMLRVQPGETEPMRCSVPKLVTSADSSDFHARGCSGKRSLELYGGLVPGSVGGTFPQKFELTSVQLALLCL